MIFFKQRIKLKLALAALLVMSSSVVAYSQNKVEMLDSDNPKIQWKVIPHDAVGTSTSDLLKADYNDVGWVNAIVPATVFTSYVEAGIEKDPNFADNIYQVDKDKYDKSFWYRVKFQIPDNFTEDKIWLNFRGINRKGEVYLNGKSLGLLDGFMHRGKFDITDIANKNGDNVLAVLVHIPKKPLNNVGSPTYISSAGWDWMPYVPGLNSGITDKVFLSNTGALVIEDPWIRTAMPTNGRADLSLSMKINNSTKDYQSAELKVTINPGNIQFTQSMGVWGNSTHEVALNKDKFEELVINNPKLWWPNGYGEPHLYTCDLDLEVGGKSSYKQQVKFGIKKYSYDTDGDVLHISINGKRVFLKGGNWGMSEYLLRCRGEEYDTKVRLHKEMNFNVIRNWLGSTTDDEFYEACDKYGILVWDDFWLNANPVLPEDIHVFNMNTIEKIKRIRNHPSVALWCGNNEGLPTPPLDNWLKENVATFDGGDRFYQRISNAEGLSGSGYWGNYDPRYYFTPMLGSATEKNASWGLRTEAGTAVFPNAESLREFLPEDKLWPRNEMWNQHFFGQLAFNATPDKYERDVTTRYGEPSGLDDFTRKAQLLNIETNQAMYEGWLDNMWEDASGIITWMSQSAYPSMVWQTYDYYYDLTGAYWGAKYACTPLHIQWNPSSNSVKVVNTTSTNYSDLVAEASIYNSTGEEVKRLRSVATINSHVNTATNSFTIPFYKNTRNIALGKKAVASSAESNVNDILDGNTTTRWSSDSNDDQWVYIDLGKDENVFGVGLNWENAYGKKYKIQVSSDTKNWKDVCTVDYGKVGVQDLFFDDISARYVRMQGVKRATDWGYSLWEFKVYGGNEHNEGLTDVHFIKLRLKDKSGKLLDENMYWRGTNRTDFTALENLPEVKLKVSSSIIQKGGKYFINAKITNPTSSPSVAFANWVQLRNSKTNKRVLPAIMSDNYFTLLQGETKELTIEFDQSLMKDGAKPVLTVEPYNNKAK